MWRKALIGVAIICGSAGPSLGMASANGPTGVEFGVGLGLAANSNTYPVGATNSALAGNLEFGYRFGGGVAPGSSTRVFGGVIGNVRARNEFPQPGNDISAAVYGISEPILNSGSGALGLEAGYGTVSSEARNGGLLPVLSSHTSGLFYGARGTLFRSHSTNLNMMVRSFAGSYKAWQAGIGISFLSGTHRDRWVGQVRTSFDLDYSHLHVGGPASTDAGFFTIGIRGIFH